VDSHKKSIILKTAPIDHNQNTYFKTCIVQFGANLEKSIKEMSEGMLTWNISIV